MKTYTVEKKTDLGHDVLGYHTRLKDAKNHVIELNNKGITNE